MELWLWILKKGYDPFIDETSVNKDWFTDWLNHWLIDKVDVFSNYRFNIYVF